MFARRLLGLAAAFAALTACGETPTNPQSHGADLLSLDILPASSTSDIYWTGRDGTVNHLDPTTGVSTLLVARQGNYGTYGITVDELNEKLYWIGRTSTGSAIIFRSDLDGLNVEQLFGINGGEHLAVDPAGGKVYWRESGYLKRANFDGSAAEVLISSVAACANTLNGWGGGLAIDPVAEKVYFGWNDGSGICRTDRDGDNPEMVVGVTDAILPRGIAIDETGRRIYYFAAFSSGMGIKRANLDGSNVQEIYDVQYGPSEVGALAIDQVAGKIYWPGYNTTDLFIKRANLDGTFAEVVGILSNEAVGIAVARVETPDSPPTVSVTSPGDGSSLPDRWEVWLVATANDPEDGDLSGGIQWASDLDGSLGTGAGVRATLSVGTHTLTASVTDSRGQLGVDQTTVTVSPDGSIPLSATETIYSFDLTSLPDGPPFTNITWRVTFAAGDPVSGSDDLVTSVYGGMNGTEPIQTRNDTHLISEGGTVYGPLTTGNPIFDPMLDGTFSFGLRMASGTATVATFAACGNWQNNSSLFSCITVTDPPFSPPDLTMHKDDEGVSVSPDGTVTFTLTYENVGGTTATGVVLTETVPANTTFNAGESTSGWLCTSGECTLDVGTVVAGGGPATATFAVTVAQPVPLGVTEINNTASVADDGTNGADPTPGNNEDSETTPLDLSPEDQLETLGQGVTDLDAVLNSGNLNSLHKQLDQVLKKLEKGQTHVAINVLNAFVQHVSDLIARGKLTSVQGQPLVDAANALLADLTG